MAIEQLKLKLIGTRPLLMHNGRLADPLDIASKTLKVLADKKKKTDAEQEETARLEFLGSLYLDDQGEPVVPSDLLLACIVAGAKKSKEGNRIKEGVWCDLFSFPLLYSGPRDHAGLWADEQFRLRKPVRVRMARVMRTRPRFPKWELKPVLVFDNTVINREDLLRVTETAGAYIGMGDWRPMYGRFEVKEVTR